MKTVSLMIALVCTNVLAADFDGRAVFGVAPAHDIDGALKRAAKEKKQVLLFSYDRKAGGNFAGQMTANFMELPETKKLVKERCLVVVLERGHRDLARYPNPGAPEKDYYALIGPDGKIVKTDMVFGNSFVGLQTVKEWPAPP